MSAAECLYLFGLDDSAINSSALECPVHQQLIAPFSELKELAGQAGFELAIASGYRDFGRQLSIWNDKVVGKRPLYDSHGVLIEPGSLDGWPLVEAILRWSALPGGSRHHWGTDIDIYDRAAVDKDYALQLSIAEVAESGPFGPLHNWLDRLLAANEALGFYRPYAHDTGGISPERWHLSYAPLSSRYESELSLDSLVEVLSSSSLLLKDVVMDNIEEIFQRFIYDPSTATRGELWSKR